MSTRKSNSWYWGYSRIIKKKTSKPPIKRWRSTSDNTDTTSLEPVPVVVEYSSAPVIYIIFEPLAFKDSIKQWVIDVIDAMLEWKYFNDKIKVIGVKLIEEVAETRWKMKDKVLMFFWVNTYSNNEFTSLLVHEFSHYLDLYYLTKWIFRDPSIWFYDISWETTKILQKWQSGHDFVSGYAMTNKYEDFAESLTYFVLHNKAFLLKTKTSEILKRKYEFFMDNIFTDSEFVWTHFALSSMIKSYYWDITKIWVNHVKFLKYLRK